MTDNQTNETRINTRKVREGIVVSDKMQSTLVVAVQDRAAHQEALRPRREERRQDR